MLITPLFISILILTLSGNPYAAKVTATKGKTSTIDVLDNFSRAAVNRSSHLLFTFHFSLDF